MRYKSFRIRNFKGIKDTVVSLETIGGAAVFAFVGLNESGKTTVLEAIHSFSPDVAISDLVGGRGAGGAPLAERVPRHLISTFTGQVSVEATLSINDAEKRAVSDTLTREHNLEIDISRFSSEVKFERVQHFQNGDFVSDQFALRSLLFVRNSRRKRWREPEGDEWESLRDVMYAHTPDIAYFPTFVFEFPEKIFLTDRGDQINEFYRSTFQDILDYDGQGHTIEKDIVRRVRGKDMVVPWMDFFSLFMQHSDRDKIQHVMDRAGAAVTRLVFGRWNKIFGEDTKGKEISILYEVIEGEKRTAQGARTQSHEHDLFIKFQIKDGTRRFNVNDRSLGFRWFFAFMLFTQFRVARNSTRPLLFLFDEPASTLHAAAQQKLIESFPEIAQGEHMLAYTTHSHYMVEPKWLEQTFIVTNRADAPENISVLDAVSLDDESLDVKVTSYRSFVNHHPTQTSYFQPILDRLQAVPSKFDIRRASVILEGKSDYYILRYASKLLGIDDLPLLPGLGAGTFGALAALHVGWNLDFLFVLDGDSQGKLERDRYVMDFGIPSSCLATIDELNNKLKVIEDLLDETARTHVRKSLGIGQSPTKGQIRRFFQERLASAEIEELGPSFRSSSAEVLDALRARLSVSRRS